MFDWLKIKNTLADARNHCKDTRETIALNKLRIEALHNLPPPRDELADMVAKSIDETACCYPQHLAASLQSFIQRPTKPVNHPRSADQGTPRAIRVLTATENPVVVATPKTIETALFYLLADQLKVAVRKAVKEMEYPTLVGPEMPKRMAEIDKLTKENVELEAKVKGLELELAQTINADG